MIAERLSVFFNDREFGEPVTWSGGSFNAQLDLPTLMTNDQMAASRYSSEVLSQAPQLTAILADIGALAAGDSISVRSTTYTVRTVEPDGTGLVLLTVTTP